MVSIGISEGTLNLLGSSTMSYIECNLLKIWGNVANFVRLNIVVADAMAFLHIVLKHEPDECCGGMCPQSDWVMTHC